MLILPPKDPNEILDYQIDWADAKAPRLVTGELLATSTLSVVEGTIAIDQVKSGFAPSGLVTVWIESGLPGEACIILNRVTTSLGRTYDQSCKLRIRNK